MKLGFDIFIINWANTTKITLMEDYSVLKVCAKFQCNLTSPSLCLLWTFDLGFDCSNNRPFAPSAWMPLIFKASFLPFVWNLLTLIINLNGLGWSICNELYIILKLRLSSFQIDQKVKTNFCRLFVGFELGGHIWFSLTVFLRLLPRHHKKGGGGA